jgi:hypothetical protein
VVARTEGGMEWMNALWTCCHNLSRFEELTIVE